MRASRRVSGLLGAERPPPPGTYRAHPSSTIIVPPARVLRPERVAFGSRVLVHEGVSILVGPSAEGVTIGDGTVLARFVHLACTRRIEIGRDVSSSDHAAIIDTWGPVDSEGPEGALAAPVIIDDGAYLGWGCIIGPGVHVGTGAFVGEGAVVVDDVAPHTVVRGNPAVPAAPPGPPGREGTRSPR